MAAICDLMFGINTGMICMFTLDEIIEIAIKLYCLLVLFTYGERVTKKETWLHGKVLMNFGVTGMDKCSPLLLPLPLRERRHEQPIPRRPPQADAPTDWQRNGRFMNRLLKHTFFNPLSVTYVYGLFRYHCIRFVPSSSQWTKLMGYSERSVITNQLNPNDVVCESPLTSLSQTDIVQMC